MSGDDFSSSNGSGDSKSIRGYEDDDEKTLLNGGAPRPNTVTYMPEDGSFTNDSSTLFDGDGSTSKNIRKFANGGSAGFSKASDMDPSIQQLRYNENRISLDRAINQSIELLGELSGENKQRPIFYPANTEDDNNNLLLNSRRAHLALVRDKESKVKLEKKKILDQDEDEEEDDATTASSFKIIKLQLKFGHSSSPNSVVFDKQTVSKLLDQQFQSQVKYLLNLKDRVDDTSSKVFVTGDLNAGKSTFCNSLLRRKVLPEDQQPCTSVFCEVIDATRENRGIEEVHAIPIGQSKEYSTTDESTFEAFQLKDLETLVYECDKYALLKVYVIDRRSAEMSLLRNGIIDVKLIDAPGLNMDSYQTTQVFSRQEEIDLVVFVVNSENHFTLSAKEFIGAAAAEKRYVFIVVNKFDHIKNKEKCKEKILDQVKGLSPDSYKNSNEFVHFVNSELDYPGDDDGDDGNDDDNDEDDNNEGRFDHLEASLRKFLLEKRSISKLLPAKSYLLNLLNDLETLSNLNGKVYSQELKVLSKKLQSQIIPSYDSILLKSSKINESVNNSIENLCTDIYDSSKKEIQETIYKFGDKQCVPYMGLQYLYEYAVATQRAMIDTVVSSVEYCEGQAKFKTASKVDEVIKVGQSTLGDEFLNDKVFKSDLMFTRKSHQLSSQLDVSIEVGDFFDPSFESFVLWLGIPEDLVETANSQMAYFNPFTFVHSLTSTAVSIKQQIPTQLTLQTLYSSTKLLTAGALAQKAYTATHYISTDVLRKVALPVVLGIGGISIVYLITDVPNAFPRKQARKLRKQLIEFDYPHVNAYRISQECRQVLNYPARQVMTNFQTSIDKRSVEKEKIEKSIADAEISFGYFQALLNKIQYQKKIVEEIDLESVNLVD
ncbi:mitofusin Fzo1p [[Candida] railenensis]|uniref:Mitofusin Fzo1p n=1 Tax=[Candida] railenensis TaxID=45579 RepID=A0A9P0QRV9_9ASCO|nr:mitofusin Fzo1p [[Candida] railenensis]